MTRQTSVYRAPILTLLTDFGLEDHYVAAMKGVVLDICPDARLVDVSHQITPYRIAEGAYVLAQAWRTFPAGTVHLAVVDPGVGSSRKALVAVIDEHYFIAPDNGLISMVLADARHFEVREITASTYFRNPISQTFHGRDVFAPVAAHIANGVQISRLGERIENYVRGSFLEPEEIAQGIWRGTVLKVDRFGNIVTNFRSERFPFDRGFVELKANGDTVSRSVRSFDEASWGAPALIQGSAGFIEVIVNQGSAADLLRVSAGDLVELTTGLTQKSDL